MTKEEFVERVKIKNPQWAKIDDEDLYEMVIKRHPVYKKKIDGLPTFKDTITTNEDIVNAEEVGFTQKLVQGIAKPFLRTGLAGYQAIQGAGALLSGKPKEATAGQTVDMGYFGNINPIGFKEAEVGERGEFKNTGEFTKDIVGTGTELASYGLTPARAGGVASKGLYQGLKSGAKQGIKEGAVLGFMGSSGSLLSDDATVGESIAEGVKGGVVGSLFGGVLGGTTGLVGAGAKKIKGRFNKADDILEQVENVYGKNGTASNLLEKGKSPLEIRKSAEATAPKLTLEEKLGGLRPDIKSRIENNPQKFKDYLDIAHARNFDDKLSTAFGYGGKEVASARDDLIKVLSDTGNDIGKFRQKVGTYKVNLDDIDKSINVFDDELSKLNLAINDSGEIVNKKGVVPLVEQSEIKLLQELRNGLYISKQNPTVKNVIDNRIRFDSKINFAKTAREASKNIDAISRKVRASLAEANRKAVGKEQSKLLQDYSNLMEVLAELNKYVDSRSGGEYLLRLVYSGRGESAKDLLQTVAKYTGKDLMDDARAAQLATELIGNADQLNLFRQEITKAGLDAKSILDALSGKSPVGAVMTLFQKGSNKAFSPERIIRKTADRALKKIKKQ